ncbi:flavin monoamine oxidase family protein [Aestuariispira insulae]|uniref:Tryptophan 2-monooxygenase n=1 Tax=Aestuariispira insulae TaxID=1461337 RepID=A0A3D9HP55_9PROT|nr:NAD(P)/FAD-dependent oxidoreductase [Aestuariispira insulae]RED51249.1 monoamine oxidase [Aestuariispira insulae]
MHVFSPISRRTFLGGFSAWAFSPAYVSASGLSDCVIVGAGIAGISAAQALRRANRSVIILEARDRIGGRAYTESKTFGVPYDHGCAWLHSADQNPLTKMIEEQPGFTIVDEGSRDLWLYLDGREASEDDYSVLEEAHENLLRRIDRAVDRAETISDFEDRSIRDLSPPKGRIDRIAHTLVGPLEAGEETKRISALDVYRQIGTGVEWMVPQGMAAGILQALGPVAAQLNTIVRRIDWQRPEILVETNMGRLRTRSVIVTVPTSLLAEETIEFIPHLPDWKRQAAENLPMGLLDKITLQFKPAFRSLAEEAETTGLLIQENNNSQTWSHILRPFGHDMTIGFLGGDTARSLSGEPDADRITIELALENLTSLFGSDIRTLFVKGHYTNWLQDPWARGAYSNAPPGQANARKMMARPVAERLFFAGEATVTDWSTQAPGAYLSGRRAAREVIEMLN